MDDDELLLFFSLIWFLELLSAFRFLDRNSFSVRALFESLPSDVAVLSSESVGDLSSEVVGEGVLRELFLVLLDEGRPCSNVSVDFATFGVAFFLPDPVLLERGSPTPFNSEVVVFGVEERKFGEEEPSRHLVELEVDSRLGTALAFHVRALLRNVGSAVAFSVRCVP
jgi:hypothetical protein